jgi:hypothetical protein
MQSSCRLRPRASIGPDRAIHGDTWQSPASRARACGSSRTLGGLKVDEQYERTALLSALTTEHFVLQTANNSTYSEASARSTLYVMALSSSLVAIGFVAGSTDVLIPFAAIVLPAVFLLGIFTVARLVETGLESMHCLQGIARIRGYYRTLGPEAARHFAAEHGRWPEVESPALKLGRALAFFGTTASMIAVINNAVAGVGIALLTRFLSPSAPVWVDAVAGVVAALVLTWLFYAYQRWRFEEYDVRADQRAES